MTEMRGDPHIDLDPARQFGGPVISGTRISPCYVVGGVLAGDTVALTCDSYGITRPQLLVAAWYEAHHGTRRTRRELGSWLTDDVEYALWSRDYGAVPDFGSVRQAL